MLSQIFYAQEHPEEEGQQNGQVPSATSREDEISLLNSNYHTKLSYQKKEEMNSKF